MCQASLHIGVVSSKKDRITADEIIKFMENNGYDDDINDVTIMEVDSEGNPIPETAQKLGNIATIELTPEPDTMDAVQQQKEQGELIYLGLCEAIDPEPKYDLKQKHYDETHSRKSNWHKRYF